MNLFEPKVTSADHARRLAGRSMLGGSIFFFMGLVLAIVVEVTDFEYGTWPIFMPLGAVFIAQGFYLRTMQWRLEDKEAGAVVG